MSDQDRIEQAINRIAKMEYLGVSRSQIAKACGKTEAEIESLMEKSIFKQQLQIIAAEDFDKMDTLNGGWDMVENLAMGKVVDHLEKVPDPDFALRAAAIANKAVRRGKHENQPIGMQANTQAVINVSLQFADKLQQNFQVEARDEKELMQKDDNFLPPKNVETLLGGIVTGTKRELQDSVNKEIDSIGIPAMAF